MHSADDRADHAGAFTRQAFVTLNPVTSRYEYSSIDTRAPQLMVELSAPSATVSAESALDLRGGTFVAPKWGELKNIRFKYRLTLGMVQRGRQTVRLYLTPLTRLPKVEFLAFEYLYTKRP